MRIIVTGGAGFIGRHLVKRLLSGGAEILVIDSKPGHSLPVLPGSNGKLTSIRADIRSNGLHSRIPPRWRGSDAIVHLAAVVSVEESTANPRIAFEVNVNGTLNMLELARELDVGVFILASSAAVYGEPLFLPIPEDHPLSPLNFYGETKLFAEKLVQSYSRLYGIRGVMLRFFNVYGPGMRDGPYAGVVHKFIHAILDDRSPVIHGDGLQTRDLVYVGDVVNSIIKAIRKPVSGPINIGSGEETTIQSLYKTLCKIARKCRQPLHDKPRPGDVRRSKADITKAKTLLKWRPTTKLEHGLRLTYIHYALQKQPKIWVKTR